MPDLLDLAIRRRIYTTARDYPGLHVRELARQVETSVALVEYHLSILSANGLVRLERDERYVRAFATGGEAGEAAPDAGERASLGTLREKLPLRIVLYLLDQDGPVQHKRIAADLGLAKSKLSFHLRKLEAARLVRKTADGLFEPVDRPRLLRLLLAYQPTPDLRAEFADLWLSLYGG